MSSVPGQPCAPAQRRCRFLSEAGAAGKPWDRLSGGAPDRGRGVVRCSGCSLLERSPGWYGSEIVGEFYGVNAEELSGDLAWLRTQVLGERNYRDQGVIDRLNSVSERAREIADARHSGQYDTWEALRVTSSSLARCLEIYRDKHAPDAPFPFGKEKGDFGVLADRAVNALVAAAG